MADRPRVLGADEFGRALVAAGVLPSIDGVRRIVIDAQAGHIVVVYVEHLGDERLLRVTPTLQGIEIRGAPNDS
jgi:hypothetical protein